MQSQFIYVSHGPIPSHKQDTRCFNLIYTQPIFYIGVLLVLKINYSLWQFNTRRNEQRENRLPSGLSY